MMEIRCHGCGAPVTRKKCDYCGAKIRKNKDLERINDQPASIDEVDAASVDEVDVLAVPWHKIIFILCLVAVAIGLGVFVYQSFSQTRIITVYVCENAPTLTTEVSDVTTVVTIEARGYTLVRWIEQDTFPRQAYIDHYWGLGLQLTDADIRGWFEGPDNVMGMQGTSWELVSIDDEFIITNFILDYENMLREELDLLWAPYGFSIVTLGSAIRGLEDQGAVCVLQ